MRSMFLIPLDQGDLFRRQLMFGNAPMQPLSECQRCGSNQPISLQNHRNFLSRPHSCCLNLEHPSDPVDGVVHSRGITREDCVMRIAKSFAGCPGEDELAPVVAAGLYAIGVSGTARYRRRS